MSLIPTPSMHEIPETRESLLLQVQNPSDQRAWEEFVEIYRPVIYRIAVARGLQHADALDLIQTVFIAIARSVGSWKKQNQRTRFRHWLRRVAKNATINAVTRRPPDQPLATSSAQELLNEIPQPDQELESLVDIEYRRELFARAAEQVRVDVHPDTWAAFELTTINGMSKEEAALELSKSIGSIYAARSRVMKRLAAIIAEMESSNE